MNLSIAICIATHNRRDDLADTLRELQRLSSAADEVLVVADGCTDGTADFVAASYPSIRLIVHDQSRGSIPSRNEMAELTKCDVFLSLDDDSYPIEPDFLARVKEFFAQRPRLAVLSFPQRTDEAPETLHATSFGPSQFVGSYANSGAAIRRTVFRELGGYPPQFFHAYEEPDFALRCVCAGWQVWHETSLTIRHRFTPAQRHELRTHQRHARNELWSVLLRCPAPQVFAVAAFRVLRQFGYAWKRGWAMREPVWWFRCLAGISECLSRRQPLPWPRYRAWMELVRHPTAREPE